MAKADLTPRRVRNIFHSLDGTQPASQDIAIVKARAAARFKRPTKALEDVIAGGVSGMASAEGGIVAAAALAALER
ncbi:MAG TPA: heme-binding protein [Gemmatimonadales bacterium]|nr:heme-binding protein [Gemmatimonadales bacterium]